MPWAVPGPRAVTWSTTAPSPCPYRRISAVLGKEAQAGSAPHRPWPLGDGTSMSSARVPPRRAELPSCPRQSRRDPRTGIPRPVAGTRPPTQHDGKVVPPWVEDLVSSRRPLRGDAPRCPTHRVHAEGPAPAARRRPGRRPSLTPSAPASCPSARRRPRPRAHRTVPAPPTGAGTASRHSPEGADETSRRGTATSRCTPVRRQPRSLRTTGYRRSDKKSRRAPFQQRKGRPVSPLLPTRPTATMTPGGSTLRPTTTGTTMPHHCPVYPFSA